MATVNQKILNLIENHKEHLEHQEVVAFHRNMVDSYHSVMNTEIDELDMTKIARIITMLKVTSNKFKESVDEYVSFVKRLKEDDKDTYKVELHQFLGASIGYCLGLMDAFTSNAAKALAGSMSQKHWKEVIRSTEHLIEHIEKDVRETIAAYLMAKGEDNLTALVKNYKIDKDDDAYKQYHELVKKIKSFT